MIESTSSAGGSQTEKGSALHEAALYGKTDVVQKLLSAGIDVNIVDTKGKTAQDTVKDMPSQKSREIAAFIQAHVAGIPHIIDLPPPPVPPPQESPSPRKKATSCHSLDSLASGKSSDRDSGRPDSEAGKKDRPVHSSHPGPGHEEEVSSEALYTNSSIDERGQPVEEEDHTYELLLTAQTKHPPPSQESQSNKDENTATSALPQRKPTAPSDLRAPSRTKDTLHPPGRVSPRAPGGGLGRRGLRCPGIDWHSGPAAVSLRSCFRWRRQLRQITRSSARIREQVSRSSSLACYTDPPPSSTAARNPSGSQVLRQSARASWNQEKLPK
ncbi:hypothetical protein FQN60_001742 [Etheostoma spectabile]|uniref:Uncharacterized protein n=1 Tax=Etheostoma spectabile TaxID=54343 RepID=A0A5J5DB11_9PERO|nr:hypothetical protein FQN60_001742 [Etheostoma spectabile]